MNSDVTVTNVKSDESPGVHKVVDLDKLESATENGWVLVRTLDVMSLGNEYQESVAPDHPQLQYGTRPPTVTLSRTVHVPRVMFLVRKSVDRRLSEMAANAEETRRAWVTAERQRAEDEAKLNAFHETVATLKATNLATLETLAKVRRTVGELTEKRHSEELAFSELRQKYDKLAAALGALKVKEILG